MAKRLELEKQDVPVHFEQVALRSWIQGAAWIVAVACVVAGVVLAAHAGGLPAEAFGVLSAGFGGTLAVALVRGRTIETVVTGRLLTVSAGPLRHRVPIGFIGESRLRPARSWRRLYADQELVVSVGHDGGSFAIPSADADQLAAVLAGRG